MTPLRIESLSVNELHMFALHEIGEGLNECLRGLSELGREAISARKDLADVRISWKRKDGRFASASEFEAAHEEAKAMCDILALRRAVLRDIKSILQTNSKAIV